MNSNQLSARKVLLSQEARVSLSNIEGVWCFENIGNDLFIIDVSHLVEHERDPEVDSLHQDALKAATILDTLPACVNWRELDLLQIAPE